MDTVTLLNSCIITVSRGTAVRHSSCHVYRVTDYSPASTPSRVSCCYTSPAAAKVEVELGVGARPSTENKQSGPASFFTMTSGPDRDTGLQIPSSSSCACCLLRATWVEGKYNKTGLIYRVGKINSPSSGYK